MPMYVIYKLIQTCESRHKSFSALCILESITGFIFCSHLNSAITLFVAHKRCYQSSVLFVWKNHRKLPYDHSNVQVYDNSRRTVLKRTYIKTPICCYCNHMMMEIVHLSLFILCVPLMYMQHYVMDSLSSWL